jgi:hypothetical protein
VIIGIKSTSLCGKFPTSLKNSPFSTPMSTKLHYVACWTEATGIYSCGHAHFTIAKALECLVPDGRSFIRARDHGVLRSLNERETRLFTALLMSARHS